MEPTREQHFLLVAAAQLIDALSSVMRTDTQPLRPAIDGSCLRGRAHPPSSADGREVRDREVSRDWLTGK